MSEGQKRSTEIIAQWLKSAQEIWTPFQSPGPPDSCQASDSKTDTKAAADQLQQIWTANLKAWQTLFESSKSDESAQGFEAMSAGVEGLPGLSAQLLQISQEGLAQMQQEWLQQIGKMQSANGDTNAFSHIDEMVLKRWTDLHHKEMQRFLNIPQLGLTRFYQEKINHAAEKYDQFQSAMGEFFVLLYLPLNKASKHLQDDVARMTKEEALPEDSKVYYDKWIKALERFYQDLFRSPEYTRSLAKTVYAMNDFVGAREAVMEDALKALPIPTHTDMDALYKEMYKLKKRIKTLERELASLKSTEPA